MTILYMDTEAVLNTRTRLAAAEQNLRDDLTLLTINVQRIVGTAWMGPSAELFYEEYTEIRSQIMQQLDALAQVSKTLQNEVTQWQEVARTFG